MTLTEQWKKGELEQGWYYITTCFADEAIREYFDGDEFRTVFTCNVKEVLAPVPSYEEWKAAYECQLMESELVLTLKELLKECNCFLYEVITATNFKFSCRIGSHIRKIYYMRYLRELKTKIDNAIGEKK